MLRSGSYIRGNSLMRRDVQNILREFGGTLKWKGNDTLLDIGSGPGDTTVDLLLARMPKGFNKLIGMDYSEDMVSFARQKYCKNYANLHFEVANIASDQQKYVEKFDHITSFYCLHYIPNQMQALSNIYHLLKPGGDCLLAILVSIVPFEIFRSMQKSARWGKYMLETKSVVSPYHDSSDPVAQLKANVEGNFKNNCSIHEWQSLYTFESINEYRGKKVLYF